MICDQLLLKSTTNEPLEKFLNAIDIFINNQNALNKKLAGSQRAFYRMSNVASSELFAQLQARMVADRSGECDKLLEWISEQNFGLCEADEETLEGVTLVVNKLIPKNPDYGQQTHILCIAGAFANHKSSKTDISFFP
jgi:hypothetical protein